MKVSRWENNTQAYTFGEILHVIQLVAIAIGCHKVADYNAAPTKLRSAE